MVVDNANIPGWWEDQFKKAMVKMASVEVKTGSNGEEFQGVEAAEAHMLHEQLDCVELDNVEVTVALDCFFGEHLVSGGRRVKLSDDRCGRGRRQRWS
ncbi:hypothetical protein GUJ93_ZPchr0006g43006 [Zizania palustris]|uniref:Uncharacterized protein n=1 Tax=Zizania palustris TaxID=103762 RepID=A0A8J5SWG9_ZIZPA|nr:hypothetical protein GUJ93_ZPchr0006g43006 [Zizania palustris]